MKHTFVTVLGKCLHTRYAVASKIRGFATSQCALNPRRSRGLREVIEDDLTYDPEVPLPGEERDLNKIKGQTRAASNSNIHSPRGKQPVNKLLDESLSQDSRYSETAYPSDVELVQDFKEYKKRSRDQASHSYRPTEVPAEDTSVMLFPGQGSQFPGMAKKLLQFPNVKEMFEVANDILRYDLLDICVNGPKSELDKTIRCQPAVFVTSLAAIERLKEESPRAIENCIATAGFSVGEFAALVFSGCMTFEDGLRLVKVRARAMQEASEAVASGMMTVFLGADNKINFACHTARQYCLKKLDIEFPVCHVANYLSTECKVVAGNVEALEFLKKHSREFGITRCKSLPVSGAFHSKLMKPACKPLELALKNVQLQSPLIPVYSNVTARQMSIQGQIKRLLVQQIIQPVKWEQIIHTVFTRPKGDDFPNVYEAGPGKQLGALLKLTNMGAYKNYNHVEV